MSFTLVNTDKFNLSRISMQFEPFLNCRDKFPFCSINFSERPKNFLPDKKNIKKVGDHYFYQSEDNIVVANATSFVIIDKSFSHMDVYLPPEGKFVETQLSFLILQGYRYILAHHGQFQMHSAVVIRNGCGIAFCGLPGAGKSTQAHLWEKHLDAEALYDYAASLGCEFRYTGELMTYGNYTSEMDRTMRASHEILDQASRNIWYKKRNLDPKTNSGLEKSKVAPVPANPDAVGIKCNAGKNTCFIRHDGMMAACNTLDAKLIDTRGRSLENCFKELSAWANTVPRISECEGCIHAVHCTTCVAAHYNDTHQFGIPSPRLCFKIKEPEKAKAEQEFFAEHGYLEL